MITHDLATAQILFLLVSDNGAQVQAMTHDLQRSRYRYFLSCHADKAVLVESVKRCIADNAGRVPAVLLINCEFAGKDCTTLLELARSTSKSAAIECVVTHPPVAQSGRQALEALGARLFDGEDAGAIAELTLH